MPILAINYSTFTPHSMSGIIEYGILENSDMRWASELSRNEKTARNQLLVTQLQRFFASEQQPMTRIAVKNGTYFLLSEIITPSKKYRDMAELQLIKFWLDLTVTDDIAIKNISNYYLASKHQIKGIHDLMNSALLKIILTPPAVFVSFVNECVAVRRQAKIIAKLQDRQEALISYLMKKNTPFKEFFVSDDAEEQVTEFSALLEVFRINNEISPVQNFTPEVIDSLHANQWQMLTIDTELYSLSDTPRAVIRPRPLSAHMREIPWTDTGVPLTDTPRLESESSLSPTSLMDRFRSLFLSPTTITTPSPLGVSRNNVSNRSLSNFFKEIRGTSMPVAAMTAPTSPSMSVGDVTD